MTTQLTTAELGGWVSSLGSLVEAVDDAERVDRLRLLEEIKAAAAAAQARETVALKASQLDRQEAAGVPAAQRGRGIGAQVALARRESPHRAGRLVGLAEALVHELPHTMTALTEGRVSEWRATLVVQATACLSRADRGRVDDELAGRLGRLGDREVVQEARRLADRLDPQAAAARSRKAAADRRVSLRPMPDTMAALTGLLPAADGVAAYTSLVVAADVARAAGDPRSRGQVMADTLLARLTGRELAVPVPATWADRIAATTWDGCDMTQADSIQTGETEPSADAESQAGTASAGLRAPASAAVEIQLVMTDQSLFGVGSGADEPAHLAGYGPVPAPVARHLVADAVQAASHGEDLAVWVRRLFTHPVTGVLTQMESVRRVVPAGLARFLRTRDRLCRTPWCGAPIRHLDHVVPVIAEGPTTATNTQGLCEACNHAKQAPGWRARPGPTGAGDLVTLTTPTGHDYLSRAPLAVGARRHPA